MAEHYELELAEHAKSLRQLLEERDAATRDLSAARIQHSEASARANELHADHAQMGRALDLAREAAKRCEELQMQLDAAKEELRSHTQARDGLSGEMQRLTQQFQVDQREHSSKVSELEATLEDRNNEIKLLMYRVQELSSKYVPVRSDPVDTALAKWINGYRPAVPFFRLAQGQYLFGRRQVLCKISNDKPVFRVGGGFIGFDKFLELYASEELERLLSYEMDAKTGEPKFIESQRALQELDQSGVLEDLRERAERGQAPRGQSPTGLRPGMQHAAADRRRSLNSSAVH